MGNSDGGLLEALGEALDMAKGCILCKSPNATIKAVFVPPTKAFSQKIGAQEGTTRWLTYGLCEPCSGLPGKADLVEAEILKRLAVQ